MQRVNKIFDFVLVLAFLIGLYVWSTVYQNASADVDSGSAKISFFDVGQADCALVNLPSNKQVLIDAGRNNQSVSRIKTRMPAFDNEIEAVFLSHPDSDHVGGFLAVLESFKVDRVYLNTDQSDSKTFADIISELDRQKVPREVIGSGRDIYIEDLRINTLWPDEEASLSENNRSLVLRFSIKNGSVLFAGDLEIEGQTKMMTRYSGEEYLANLYKVPHHGALGAWNESFAKKVGAKNAVISVGPNSYGHPSEKVITGLEDLGTKVYRTDQNGTIDFVLSDQGFVKK